MGMKHDPNTYEPEVFKHAETVLDRGALVYDVGAYDGITSVRLANMVGGSNVVIIEPAEMNWATIQAYWNKHELPMPRATYAGFVSDEDKPGAQQRVKLYDWPEEVSGHPVAEYEEGLNFRNLDRRHLAPEIAARPWLTLDTIARTVNAPVGIFMDIEGAELLALRGAEQLLRRWHPFLWISIHGQLMKNFGHHEDDVRKYLTFVGYQGHKLYEDQEQHWFFEPAPRPQ